ncbi:MAG TPA: Ig-like domain-containing protein, partial [bacterium]|nr:Ig-like domain-containing protein [bacterium]
TFFSFAKFSPDGNYVLFTSDMNGSARSDVFLAELPTSGAPVAPSVTTLTPTSIATGAAGFTLTVTGSNFTPSSVVQWNGTSRATTFSGGAQLQATILANDVVNAGTAQVTVLTPAPGGGLSTALPFTISPIFLASVVRAGTGSGTVASTPAGINCGTSCAAPYVSGTVVTLTATPAVNSTVGTWSGCDVVAGSQCTVTVASARTVTAAFQAQPATPPSVSMTSPTAGTQVAGVAPMSASATSPVGIAGVQFQLDGVNQGAEVTTPPYTMTWNSATVANGSHALVAVARDTTSIRTTSPSVGVTVGNPPIISSVTVSSSTSSNVSVVWTTNMPSTSQIEYGLTTSYGTAMPLDTALVTAHVMIPTNLTSGTLYHYRVKSQDAIGILAISGDFAFTTMTPPTVSMTSPTTGVQVAGTVPISASATSSMGIAGVQFQLDGLNLGAEITTAPYTVTWNTATVANGSHSLAAVARDTTSIRTTSLSIGVTVGNPPVISSVTVSSSTPSSVSVVWATNVPTSSQIEYGLTASYGNTTMLATTLVTAHAVTLTSFASGTLYHYCVKSQDAGGILSISGDFTFTTQPAPSTTTPATTPLATGPTTPVVWANPVNVIATGGSLQKTSGCDGCFDAGAYSQQQIPSGTGYIEFTATETGALRFAGLAHAFAPNNQGTIDFAFRFQAGIAEVRELGVYRTDVPFITGDVFRISVASGTVRYYKNGSLVYTSTVVAAYPLVGASALANLYATVTNATMGGVSAIGPVPLAPVAWRILFPVTLKADFLKAAAAVPSMTAPLILSAAGRTHDTSAESTAKKTRYLRGQAVTAAVFVNLLKVRGL